MQIGGGLHFICLFWTCSRHRFYDDALDPEDAYDPEAELMAGDDAELGEEIVDGNDPSGLTGDVANRERITTPYMTKYERARILGTRALQIR